MSSYVSVHRLEHATPGLNWSSVNVEQFFPTNEMMSGCPFSMYLLFGSSRKLVPLEHFEEVSAFFAIAKYCKNTFLLYKYQEMTYVSWERHLPLKLMWTQCNFTRGSFYIREQIYIYVKIHTCVNFVHVNCTKDMFYVY